MPGLMILRPLAAAGKASRRASKLSEKVAEERDRAPPLKNVKASRVHPISMPVFRPTLQTTPQLLRSKQVTDPWPENVRARLVGSGMNGEKVNYSSSGSEHGPSSNCLAAMVHEFMEEVDEGKCGRARCNCESGSCDGDAACPEDDDSKSSHGSELTEILQGLAPCVTSHEKTLLAEVLKAMDAVAGEPIDYSKDDKLNCANSGCRRRSVMKHLRDSGYNAALCKSRWDHAGSFPGGDYEYLDVVFSNLDGPHERLIVDIDFQGQFEIARPTSQYKHVYQALPAVYVGTSARLLQILNVMSDAVKRSLKKKGMFLPPWRKPEYMKAKWFSSYKRTTNESSQSRHSGASGITPYISIVAVRGTGWDRKFTIEMELDFEKAGSRQVMREMKNGVELPKAVEPSVKRLEEEPEGVARGGNRLKYLWSDVKDDFPREIQETDNTNWQPPALLPRASNRRGTSTGLTSILKEAGLISDYQQTKHEDVQDFKSPLVAM